MSSLQLHSFLSPPRTPVRSAPTSRSPWTIPSLHPHHKKRLSAKCTLERVKTPRRLQSRVYLPSRSISTNTYPPLRHPSRLGGSRTDLPRRKPDLRPSRLQLAFSPHIHLQNNHSQEVRILAHLPLPSTLRPKKRSSGFRAGIGTASFRSSAASTSAAVVRLHLNGGRVDDSFRKIRCVERLLEGCLPFFKGEWNRIEISSLSLGCIAVGCRTNFRTETWKEEGMRPEHVVDGGRCSAR